MELELTDVCLKYRGSNLNAVDSFNYTFRNGVYGVLGPNGAGKTTLFRMLTQNIKPTSGSIKLDSLDIYKMNGEYRSLIGFMPQQQELYDDFTGDDFLCYMASLKGIRRGQLANEVDRVLNIVNMQGERHKRIKNYSGGMRQRILIAQAFLGNPQIVILDEPTAGLDPKERIGIRTFISNESRDRIVILATHIVSDIECIANNVIIMKDGKMLRCNTPQALAEEISGSVYEITVTTDQLDYYKRDRNVKIVNLVQTPDGLCIRVVMHDIPKIGMIRQVTPCMEDLYIDLAP